MQAEFLIRSLKRLLHNYAAIGRKVCHIALVGHSFGGVAIARALTKKRSKTPCPGCNVDEALDLRVLNVLSVFFVNAPLGGHPVLQLNLGMAWLYRRLHADLASVLRPPRSLRQLEERLRESRVLLPSVVGLFAMTSGHLDHIVPAEAATLPAFTPVMAPSAFRVLGALHAAQRRLFFWQGKQLAGKFTVQRSHLNGSASSWIRRKGGEGGVGDSLAFWGRRSAADAEATCALRTPFLFYLRLPLPQVATVQEASCHDCPLFTSASLSLLTRLLRLQGDLARRLEVFHLFVNDSHFCATSSAKRLPPTQRSPVAIRRQLKAIQGRKTEFTVLQEHLRRNVIPLVESGIAQLLPWKQLQRQETSLTQLLEDLARARLGAASDDPFAAKKISLLSPRGPRRIQTHARPAAQESCSLETSTDMLEKFFCLAKTRRVQQNEWPGLVPKAPAVAPSSLYASKESSARLESSAASAAIRASVAASLPVSLAKLVELSTETQRLLREALVEARLSGSEGSDGCDAALAAQPFCLLSPSRAFRRNSDGPEVSSAVQGGHSSSSHYWPPPLFSQLQLGTDKSGGSLAELCDMRFLGKSDISPRASLARTRRVRLDYLHEGLRRFTANSRHSSRLSDLSQDTQKLPSLPKSILFLAVNLPPGSQDEKACSVDGLQHLVLRKVDSQFDATFQRGSRLSLDRICFFAVQTSVALEFPLGGCGWTFDGAAAALFPGGTGTQELSGETQKERCDDEWLSSHWFLVVLNVGALFRPAKEALINSANHAEPCNRHSKEATRLGDGERPVWWESVNGEPTSTGQRDGLAVGGRAEFPWQGEVFRFDCPFLQWLQSRFPLLNYLATFVWPLKARVVSRRMAQVATDLPPPLFVTSEKGDLLSASLVWLPFSQALAHLTPLDITFSVHCIASNGEAADNKQGSHPPASVWLALCDASESELCSLKKVVESPPASADSTGKVSLSSAEAASSGDYNSVWSSPHGLHSWAASLFYCTAQYISSFFEFFLEPLEWRRGSSANEFAVRLTARPAAKNAQKPLPRFPQGIPEPKEPNEDHWTPTEKDAFQNILEADPTHRLARIGELAAEALQETKVRKISLQEHLWHNVLLVVIPDPVLLGGLFENETPRCREGERVVFELEAKASFHAAARSVLVLYFCAFLAFVSSAVALVVALAYLRMLSHFGGNIWRCNRQKEGSSQEVVKHSTKQNFRVHPEWKCRRLLRQTKKMCNSFWIPAVRDLSRSTIAPFSLICGSRTGGILYLIYALVSNKISSLLHSQVTPLDKESLWGIFLYREPLTAFIPMELPLFLQMLLQLMAVLVVCSAVQLLLGLRFLAPKDSLWRLVACMQFWFKYVITSLRAVALSWSAGKCFPKSRWHQHDQPLGYNCWTADLPKGSADPYGGSSFKGLMHCIGCNHMGRCCMPELNTGERRECSCQSHDKRSPHARMRMFWRYLVRYGITWRSVLSRTRDSVPAQLSQWSLFVSSGCSCNRTSVTVIASSLLIFAAATVPHVVTLTLVPLYAILLIAECSPQPCTGQCAQCRDSFTLCDQCTNGQQKVQSLDGFVVALYIQPMWLLTLTMSNTIYFILQAFDFHVRTEDGKSLVSTVRCKAVRVFLLMPPLDCCISLQLLVQ